MAAFGEFNKFGKRMKSIITSIISIAQYFIIRARHWLDANGKQLRRCFLDIRLNSISWRALAELLRYSKWICDWQVALGKKRQTEISLTLWGLAVRMELQKFVVLVANESPLTLFFVEIAISFLQCSNSQSRVKCSASTQRQHSPNREGPRDPNTEVCKANSHLPGISDNFQLLQAQQNRI